jgi:L-ornithine N5-oxygenase
MHRKLLHRWSTGDFEVDRTKLITDERRKAGIYMQGLPGEPWLSDTLLSILPIRADEIAGSLYDHGNVGMVVRWWICCSRLPAISSYYRS